MSFFPHALSPFLILALLGKHWYIFVQMSNLFLLTAVLFMVVIRNQTSGDS